VAAHYVTPAPIVSAPRGPRIKRASRGFVNKILCWLNSTHVTVNLLQNF